MKRTIATACALLLSACTTMSPNMVNQSIHNVCSTGQFVHYPECFESRLDRASGSWRSGPEASIWSLYIAWAKAAAARVMDGSVTELEAMTAATGLHAEMATIAQDIYFQPQIARSRLQTLELPDFRERSGAPMISCTSVTLGGGIGTISCR